MEETKVKELMVPLAEYATVSEGSTMFEAVLALEEAQRRFDQRKDRHRAILVLDKSNHVIGKLSQLDVIRGLEPGYKSIARLSEKSLMGFSPDLIKPMLDNYGLWQKPLKDICGKAAQVKVREIMYTPGEGEYVREDATLNVAIHQLIVGHHQSLLVTRGKEIVGVLRLSDVFRHLCDLIKTCEI